MKVIVAKELQPEGERLLIGRNERQTPERLASF